MEIYTEKSFGKYSQYILKDTSNNFIKFIFKCDNCRTMIQIPIKEQKDLASLMEFMNKHICDIIAKETIIKALVQKFEDVLYQIITGNDIADSEFNAENIVGNASDIDIEYGTWEDGSISFGVTGWINIISQSKKENN